MFDNLFDTRPVRIITEGNDRSFGQSENWFPFDGIWRSDQQAVVPVSFLVWQLDWRFRFSGWFARSRRQYWSRLILLQRPVTFQFQMKLVSRLMHFFGDVPLQPYEILLLGGEHRVALALAFTVLEQINGKACDNGSKCWASIFLFAVEFAGKLSFTSTLICSTAACKGWAWWQCSVACNKRETAAAVRLGF